MGDGAIMEWIIKKNQLNKVYAGGKTLRKTIVDVQAKNSWDIDFSPVDDVLARQEALRVVACIPNGTKIKMYPFKDDPDRDWADTYIQSCQVTGPGTVVITLVEPNID